MYDFNDEYKRGFETLKSQVITYQSMIERAKFELDALQSNDNSGSKYKIDSLKRSIFLLKYSLHKMECEMEFFRPDTQEDFDYRTDIYFNYSSIFKDTLRDFLPLRFHGTQIYYARDIIQSGEISCSQDRHGYSTSHDLCGHISVTTVQNIELILYEYVSLLDFCLPAGCIFVLLPNKEDRGVRGNQMKKVDFKKNPNVLFAILTTLENVPRVRDWCRSSGVDENKVCDFHEFLTWDFSKEQENCEKQLKISQC